MVDVNEADRGGLLTVHVKSSHGTVRLKPTQSCVSINLNKAKRKNKNEAIRLPKEIYRFI